MLFPQSNRCRSARTLDGYWDFQTDPTQSGWKENWEKGLPASGVIAVPASWNEQRSDLYHEHGWGWYQLDFELSEEEMRRAVILHFDSVQYTAQVYVNGQKAGVNTMPYLPFEMDISAMAHVGRNRLCVAVNGTPEEDEPIGDGDFYRFSGIHRSVHLCFLPETRIDSLKVKTSASGEALICAWIAGDAADIRLTAEIDGVTTELQNENGIWSGKMNVPDVKLWSPETPCLYGLTVNVMRDGKTVDQYAQKVGFRDIAVSGRDILLNGKKIVLRGFGKHEDFPVLGKGVCAALNVRDMDLMRWVGANSFRTSHYPYSEEMLELADRLGFLVISETPFVALKEQHFTSPVVCQKAKDCLKRLIERDRNHPSVLSFSMGNECQSDSPHAETFFLPLIELARQMDDRPVTYVAWTKPEEDKVYPHVDIVGLNRYYGWYGYECWQGSAKPGDLTQALRQFEECLEIFEKQYTQPLLVSEFGADTIAGFHSTFMLQFTEEFQTRFLCEYLKIMERHPAVAGMHIWNFADFATEQSPGRALGNRKGLFTRTREPKQAAFAVRRMWTSEDADGLMDRGARNTSRKADFVIPGMG